MKAPIGNIGQATPKLEQSGRIVNLIQETTNCLQRLSEEVAALEAQLGPVLCRRHPEPSSPQTGPSVVKAELISEHLECHLSALRFMHERIRDLSERIEI